MKKISLTTIIIATSITPFNTTADGYKLHRYGYYSVVETIDEFEEETKEARLTIANCPRGSVETYCDEFRLLCSKFSPGIEISLRSGVHYIGGDLWDSGQVQETIKIRFNGDDAYNVEFPRLVRTTSKNGKFEIGYSVSDGINTDRLIVDLKSKSTVRIKMDYATSKFTLKSATEAINKLESICSKLK